MRLPLLLAALHIACAVLAQPDTLYVTEHGTTTAYAVVYAPMEQAESFTRIGRYATDTARVAVRLGYKRGKPCGVYRAYYPDGSPLIFAVYGWGTLAGDWTEYAADGRITVKGRYTDGLRDGLWAFRDQGIVGHYKKGKKHGKWKYFENGRLVRVERYRDDVLTPGSTFLFR